MKSQSRFRLLSAGVGLMAAAFALPSQAMVIVDDSFADDDLMQTGALDTDWWTSSSSSGIEISPGSLGLVTGTSGRGIHTVFPTQTLSDIGNKLTATYTFTTPATVGNNKSTAFRVGLFDTLGRAGLEANVSASSSSPNPVFGQIGVAQGLPGYMFDMDVNTDTADLNFREHSLIFATGRLMGTTSGFNNVSPSGPDNAYDFDPNTTYTGTFSIERISATEFELVGTLVGGSVNETHSVTDEFDSADIGMLAFHANSNTFGSTNSQDVADNGIDFSNIKVEFVVPEPSTAALGLAGGLLMLRRRK